MPARLHTHMRGTRLHTQPRTRPAGRFSAAPPRAHAGDLSLDKLEDRFASGSREEAAAPPQQQQHPPAATPQPAASGPMLTDTQAARVPTYGGPPLPTDPAAPVEPEGGHHAAGPPAGQLQQSISSVVDQVALGDMGAGPDFTRLKVARCLAHWPPIWQLYLLHSHMSTQSLFPAPALQEGVRAEVAQVEDAVGRAAHTVEDAVGHAVDAAKHALRPGVLAVPCCWVPWDADLQACSALRCATGRVGWVLISGSACCCCATGHAHTEQPGHLPPAPGTEPKGNGGPPSKL